MDLAFVLRTALGRAALAAALVISAAAPAQEHARTILLVARPGMPDPNFSESVVLVTQDDKANAIGVIVNRPMQRSLASILPGDRFRQFTEPVFFGGPVSLNGLFALFRAESSPGNALSMLPGVYLALSSTTLDELMQKPPAKIRFFFGYAGWGPEQLRGELERGDWYVLNADADTVFTPDTRGLWDRLVRKARTVTADRHPAAHVALNVQWQ